MAQTTIEKFATDLKMPSGILLEQLAKAGVAGKKEGDKLSEQDKTRLLDYLRKQHGGQDQKKKITLTRKQTSEIKAADSTGRARTIQVEVRKRRIFVKRDGAEGRPFSRPFGQQENRQRLVGTLVSAGRTVVLEKCRHFPFGVHLLELLDYFLVLELHPSIQHLAQVVTFSPKVRLVHA